METKIGKAINKVEARQEVRFGSQIYNLFVLQMAKIGKSPILYLSLLFFPLLFIVGVGVLIPASINFTPSMSMLIIIVSGLVFADLYYGIEKSTFKSNTNTSNYGPKTKLFSVMIITFIITLISVAISIILMMLLETYTDILISKFVFYDVTSNQNLDIVGKFVPGLDITYYGVITILLSTSIGMFLKILISEYRLFVMIIFVFFIMDLVFGGVLVSTYNRNAELYGSKVYSKSGLEDNSTQIVSLKNLYSLTIFVTPTYFMNVIYCNVLRVGASQGIGIYGGDANMEFFGNPDVIVGEGPSYVTNFNEAGITGDKASIDGAYVQNISSFSPYTSMLKPNGDGTMGKLYLAPIIYIITLTTLGFTKRI